MAVRQPKVASLSETRFCLLTVSPRRAWTTWRPRTRSKAAPATSASLCRSKPWPSPQLPRTLYLVLVSVRNRKTFVFMTVEDRDTCFNTHSHNPLDLKLHFHHRDFTSTQMFTVVVGAWSSCHTQKRDSFCLISWKTRLNHAEVVQCSASGFHLFLFIFPVFHWVLFGLSQ